jgi:hypothetical protein
LKAVCLASGPSLSETDVEAVRVWRSQSPDRLVVVANTTFRIAPWADALFAMDSRWWKGHYAEVRETFQGRRLTTANLDSRFDVEKIKVNNYRNSGAGCVSIAVDYGYRFVILLGYDCMPDGNLTHWHGSHPQGMSDAKTIKVWPVIFGSMARDMKRQGVKVVNASHRTALTCFERMALDDVLLLP